MQTPEIAFGAATTAVAIAGFGGLIYSIRIDHSRRRRQATLEFYFGTIGLRHGFQDRLPQDRDVDAVRDYARGLLETDDARSNEFRDLVRYLSYHELLAIGTLAGVFDGELLKKLAGSRIKAVIQGYGPFMATRRKRWPNDGLYDGLEQLAGRWRIETSTMAPSWAYERRREAQGGGIPGGGEEEE